MNEETCVICGATIPEGQRVCGSCCWFADRVERMTIDKLLKQLLAETQKKGVLLYEAKKQGKKIAFLMWKIKMLNRKMEGKSESAPIYQIDEIATGNGEHRD